MKTRKQKGINSLVVGVLVVVVVALGAYVVIQRQQAGQNGVFNMVIRTPNDLTVLAADVDNTDTSNANTQLNQLDADSSSF